MRWHEEVDGFSFIEDALGIRLRLTMPDDIGEELCADLWCRGPLMDSARGRASVFTPVMTDLYGSERSIAPWQVHGTAIVECRDIWAYPSLPKADGIHLDREFCGGRRSVATLRFADCSPVVIASARPRVWAMILHSGFHGTTKNILGEATRRASIFYGTFDPRDLYVWIGPSIGKCCYTRKNDDPYCQSGKMRWHITNFKEHLCETSFDIKSEIISQALDEGVYRRNIFQYPHCTSCRDDIFYSYRKGDLESRMTLAAVLS